MYKDECKDSFSIYMDGIFMQFEYRKTQNINLVSFFVVGLFGGMIIMNLGKSILLENTGLLDEYTLQQIEAMTVEHSAFFYFVLKERFSKAIVLAILSTTYLGMVICIGTVWWYGMCIGAFLAGSVIRYGFKGVLLVCISIFPHYLFYIPAIIALFAWCEKLYRTIYYEQRQGRGKNGQYGFLRYLLQFMGIVIALLIGVFLESFLNPILLKSMLRFF